MGIVRKTANWENWHNERHGVSGKELIRTLLSKFQPLIILMDEVLEYSTKAAGVMVGQ